MSKPAWVSSIEYLLGDLVGMEQHGPRKGSGTGNQDALACGSVGVCGGVDTYYLGRYVN